MSETDTETASKDKSACAPKWYANYANSIVHKSISEEINLVENMSPDQLEKHLGGRLSELPYECLRTLFPNGSGHLDVANILRSKRTDYLQHHPEEQQFRGASEGTISFDGRFISESVWKTASPSEKRGILVGSTCIHYNSDTPNMDSEPSDRY